MPDPEPEVGGTRTPMDSAVISRGVRGFWGGRRLCRKLVRTGVQQSYQFKQRTLPIREFQSMSTIINVVFVTFKNVVVPALFKFFYAAQ